jgi:uncharacterized protein YbjT (DUF2867 family)
MARALIVGCGCRGRLLGVGLLEEGWMVRGTSRREEGLVAIADAGIEPTLADPLAPGSVLNLVGDVATVVWLLGSASGDPEEVGAIHGERLERLLERLVETPVRQFVYEARGSVDAAVLGRGMEVVEAAADTWQIPVATLLVDPRDSETWPDPLEVWLDSALNSVLETAGPAR